MEIRASAIIISKRHILLIHRIRAQREFYVFPGGHIEEGESAQAACIREVREETGLETAWIEFAFEHGPADRPAHYFFVQTAPGTLSLGGPEIGKLSQTNRYLLEWVPLVQIGGIALQPAAVQKALLQVVVEDGPVYEARDLAQRRQKLVDILLIPG